MFDSDQWSEIADALSKNKLRSFLTAFGIFWGVFMLVLLMGGGRGLETLLAEQFAGFASNAGFASTSTTSKPYMGFSEGRTWRLSLADVQRVKAAVPQLDVVAASNNTWGQTIAYRSRSIRGSLTGIMADYQQIAQPKLSQGRIISNVDLLQRRKVCIIGSRIAEALFPGETNVCGRQVDVNGSYFTIIGVDSRSGNGINFGGNAQSTVTIPITTYQQMFGTGDIINILAFTVKSGYTVSAVQKDIARVLRRAHSIHPDDEQAIILLNTEAIFQLMDSLFHGISILVWMIGIGTILSGAIGVSNIMMVTVRERTTEIGIRRAIGATPRAIMQQILSESMVLTLIAGMSGISFSVIILAIIETLIKSDGTGGDSTTFLISFWTALGSAILIAIIGLAAGITPAMRAMRIRPVEAMRSDE